MTSERYARVKEIFLAVCGVDAASREEIIARECAGDEELRQEVESLLKHHNAQTLIADDRSPTDSGQAAAVKASSAQAVRRLMPSVSRLDHQGQAALGASLAVLLILAMGFWAYGQMSASLSEILKDKLQAIVGAKESGLRLWLELEKERVESWSREPDLRQHIRQLSELAATPNSHKALAESSHQQEVRDELRAIFGPSAKFAIWDQSLKTIADWSPDGKGLGEGVTPEGAALLSQVLDFDGTSLVRLPDRRGPITKNYPTDPSRPYVEFFVPVRDNEGRTFAVILVYEIGAANRMNAILSSVRLGKSGESYAFNRQGMMISESRFNDQLRQLGLIPAATELRSSLAIELRDPGGDLTTGFKSVTPREACPLTEMARHATAGLDGVDVNGYRDYRGVLVVGAWRWLPELGIGVATEMDYEEAYAPLRYLRVLLATLCIVLLLSIGGIVNSFLSIRRLRRQMAASRRVGPYALESVIGEGGMGVVYRARHDLLNRPAAVKLLRPELVNAVTRAWFEREVQLASQLQHPNTIEIYDFGVSESGDFYYAMEYLTGVTLAQLVDVAGPIPPARAIYILQQVCGSLREAHERRLVHRDIKPQNIMLCDLGGAADFVKVLDFGLAKSSEAEGNQTARSSLVGTPLYMAPERFRDSSGNDPRSDLYAIGAVGYKLLTGHDIFLADSPAAMMQQVLFTAPTSPSTKSPQAIPPALDQLIVDCLAKDPNQRPKTADEILVRLNTIVCDTHWDEVSARQWWTEKLALVRSAPAP
jgi:hypothetical protein